MKNNKLKKITSQLSLMKVHQVKSITNGRINRTLIGKVKENKKGLEKYCSLHVEKQAIQRGCWELRKSEVVFSKSFKESGPLLA